MRKRIRQIEVSVQRVPVLGPLHMLENGGPWTGGAADSGLGSAARKVEETSGSLAERLCRVDLCEVFSPPRVGKGALKFGLEVGDAMDLITGWDFIREKQGREARG